MRFQTDETHAIFVYGTLMRGERAHGLLRGSRFVGAAETRPGYELALMDGYPALVMGGRSSVRGEVFAVPSMLMPALDEYEDVPELYARRDILLADGSTAQAYLLHAHHAEGRPRIASGDWRRR